MYGMMKIFTNFKEFYNDINGATLTGAIDVVVVEQADGNFNCSPFHVRFGKLGVLRSKEKVVDIQINGEPQSIHMKLGESGEAFFVEELDDENEIPDHLATSPIPVSEFENMYKAEGIRRRSFDLTQEMPDLENQVSDFSKRRYTDDNENSKTRERNFLKKHINLGNISSYVEDLPLTHQYPEDVFDPKSQNISDTIFKMDSSDDLRVVKESHKNEVVVPPASDAPTETKSTKKKKKKMRRKNAPRKSASNIPVNGASSENTEKISDSVADRSSLDSNSSESELKEKQNQQRDMPIGGWTQRDSEEDPEAKFYKNVEKETPQEENYIQWAKTPDFHFFSDTEITTSGNVDSRSSSPVHVETVQSDSEFELTCRKEGTNENSKSWEWGGFPSVSQTSSPTSENPSKEEHKSMLSGMFSFMKQKHGTPTQLQGGMYLSEISSVDPEVAEIYFNQTKNKSNTDADMDCESGNGPSLAQSPNSGEGCKSIDSDFEEQAKLLKTCTQNISLSLCGWEPEPTEERFLEHVVEFSDLCNSPTLLEHPNLVVRIGGKFLTWKVTAPIIASIMIYGRPLVQSSVDQLCNVHMPSTSVEENKEEPKQEVISRSWWNWRRSRISETVPAPEANTSGGVDFNEVSHVVDLSQTSDTKEINAFNGLTEEEYERIRQYYMTQNAPTSDKYKKTLRLSSKQIASLNLRDGVNEVEFSVTTAYQGTTRCICHLYKWKWDDKIVISDIDGTITKSDVLGHILPIVGKDWAQSGVAQLFNKIKNNGYKLLYLSARAIGQARITRDYLRSIKQGDSCMPDGPILLNPTSLITAFHREVIEKKPEQFKISCMNDIKALFPADSNPFYAGYGNRINDVWAYTAVGIPIVRIFTINPKGELKHELTQTFQSSYSNMSYIVDHLFPPLLEAANDYSQFVYWREPVPVIDEVPELA